MHDIGGCGRAPALLCVSNRFYRFFINGNLLAGRNASSLDSISSGRISIILNAFPHLREHWLFGVGDYYIDCFPIAAWIQFWPFGGGCSAGFRPVSHGKGAQSAVQQRMEADIADPDRRLFHKRLFWNVCPLWPRREVLFPVAAVRAAFMAGARLIRRTASEREGCT